MALLVAIWREWLHVEEQRTHDEMIAIRSDPAMGPER